MNREWASIGGPWLGLGATNFGATGLYANTGNFDPYTTAPNSAHVMWTLPEAFGGQIGGEFGSSETGLYATGTAYETKFGAVILNGILYYTEYPGAGNNPVGLKAVDIRTGETVWERNITTPLKCGMILTSSPETNMEDTLTYSVHLQQSDSFLIHLEATGKCTML